MRISLFDGARRPLARAEPRVRPRGPFGFRKARQEEPAERSPKNLGVHAKLGALRLRFGRAQRLVQIFDAEQRGEQRYNARERPCVDRVQGQGTHREDCEPRDDGQRKLDRGNLEQQLQQEKEQKRVTNGIGAEACQGKRGRGPKRQKPQRRHEGEQIEGGFVRTKRKRPPAEQRERNGDNGQHGDEQYRRIQAWKIRHAAHERDHGQAGKVEKGQCARGNADSTQGFLR